MARGFLSTASLDLRRPLRQIDPADIPVELTESGSLVGRQYVLLGLLITPAAGLVVVLGVKPCPDSCSIWFHWVFAAGAALFALLGALCFGFGLWRCLSKTVVRLAGDRIALTRVTPRGAIRWSEPTSSYAGVLLRREMRPYGRSQCEVHLLELRHWRADHNVILYESRVVEDAVACWPSFCRVLGLPALELDGDVIVQRPAANLERSVHDLVAGGQRHLRFDPSAPAPAGLGVEISGYVLSVTVLDRRPYPVLGLVAAVILTMGLAIGLTGEIGKSALVIGLVSGGVLGLLLTIAWLTQDHIVSRPGRLRICGRFLGIRTKGRTFDASQIRSVTVDGKDGVVRIRTDKTLVSVGGGLSAGALRWLRDCIEAAVSAPHDGGSSDGG